MEFYDVIWRTADDITELCQCQHCDIFVLLQGVQGFVVNARLQEPVLADTLGLHGFPQWAEVDDADHPNPKRLDSWKPGLAFLSIIG